MPYLTCQGKTYSRYDTSLKVKECIKKEREEWLRQEQTCQANPVCL